MEEPEYYVFNGVEYYVYHARAGQIVPGHITHVLLTNFPYPDNFEDHTPWSHVTHILIAENITFIPEIAFYQHPNIKEVICHKGVLEIELDAFYMCRNLRRVIMPGVIEVGGYVFYYCDDLTYIDCGKLEILGSGAFQDCASLHSIDLPSIRSVEDGAFEDCWGLYNVKFGKNLELFDSRAFLKCSSLERVTIPLKNGLITADDVFAGCGDLKQIDLVEREELQETVASFLLEDWRTDMNEEIDSIVPDLQNADEGRNLRYHPSTGFTPDSQIGEKAMVVRRWMSSVISKLNHYKAEHQRLLNESATVLDLAIWKANLNDTDESRLVREGVRTTRGSLKRARREISITSGASVVIKNVLPFLQLKL